MANFEFRVLGNENWLLVPQFEVVVAVTAVKHRAQHTYLPT